MIARPRPLAPLALKLHRRGLAAVNPRPFLTWPPQIPARHHPPALVTKLHPDEPDEETVQRSEAQTDTELRPYGWGDWLVASSVAGGLAWPVSKVCDGVFDFAIEPLISSVLQGDAAVGAALGMCSLALHIPKLGASYYGAHIYCPRAWWFWKLTLLPALPAGLLLVSPFMALGLVWIAWNVGVDFTDGLQMSEDLDYQSQELRDYNARDRASTATTYTDTDESKRSQ